MQATGGTTSSFSMSDRIKQDIEDRAKAASQKPEEQEQRLSEEEIEAKVSETTSQLENKDAPKEETQEERDRKRLLELKGMLEKRLEVVFSEDDLSEYILRGSVSKQVTIVPGVLRGIFRTLSTSELQMVDERMRELTAKERLTTSGLENERAMLLLSKAWVGIQQKKRSEAWSGAAKPFGKSPEERIEAIQKMGAMVIQYAADAWANYNTLLKMVFEEETLLKK